MVSIVVLTIGILSTAVCAQQTLYGQCGGEGWTGPTTCVSGSYCSFQNDWYSQCIPGTASTTLATVTKTTSTSTSTTTSQSTTTTKATTTKATTTSTTTKTSTSSQPTTTTSTGSGTYEYFITFGDSYSQTGFEITGTKATAGNILGNPPFPGFTTTNGDNWIDFCIATYNKSLILSYNFAYGGATTDANLATPYESTVLSFVDQVTEFSDNLASKPSYAPWTSSNTLFGVWMGVNDVGNDYYNSSWTTLAPEIITRYFEEVQILYNAGGRNFVFLTVPPIQYTPMVVAQGTSVQATEGAAVATYNNLLSSALASFKSANSGVNAYLYDTTTPFMTAINDPTAYGAPNATCFNADGVSCLWWNNYHPGQAIQNLVAQGVAALVGI